MQLKETALVVIDSGFNTESIARARRVVAIYDLPAGVASIGSPTVSQAVLERFSDDPMKHGSLVLDKLTAILPDAPYILIRAFRRDKQILQRTEWSGGRISTPGWCEAYRWAVDLCRKNGWRSVTNCSFGGFIHGMDGTGWEAFQLSHETGRGKPNHIVVAAAGAGDARASHASWSHLPCDTVTVKVVQKRDSMYNLWAARQAAEGACSLGLPSRQWLLTVKRDGRVLFHVDGTNVPFNIWNQRQQQTFWVHGQGSVELVFERRTGSDTACGDSQCAQRFDVWLTSDRSASFLNYVDPTLIAEPAIFPHVIAVGLRNGSYAPDQAAAGTKPDVLLPGAGPISFRAPELTAAIGRLLMESDTDLDVEQVRALLGKYPDCLSLAKTGLRG